MLNYSIARGYYMVCTATQLSKGIDCAKLSSKLDIKLWGAPEI